jgi:hypothetical protein
MHPGFIVGTSLATVALIAGLIGLVNGRRRRERRQWPGWLIVFGVSAWISALINFP